MRIKFPIVALCLLLSTSALPQVADVIEEILAPASSSSIRKTEAAIVELKDGRLLLGYTDFYTVSPNDDAPARIPGATRLIWEDLGTGVHVSRKHGKNERYEC